MMIVTQGVGRTWRVVGSFGWLVSFALGLSLLVTPPLAAEEESAELPDFLPGLIGRYVDAATNAEICQRIERAIAFDFLTASPDERIPSGPLAAPLAANWSGQLTIQSAGKYQFFLYGRGHAELLLGGKAIIPQVALRDTWADSLPVELESEDQALEIRFDSAGLKAGEGAKLALFWSGPGFGREPVPARLLQHAREKTVSPHYELGRQLARALKCENCHAAAGNSAKVLGEKNFGPDLTHLRGNLNPSWLRTWLAAGAMPEKAGEKILEGEGPDVSHPARQMPRYGLSSEETQAMTQYLFQTSQPTLLAAAKPDSKPLDRGAATAAKGERLLVTLGCLACHTWGNLGTPSLTSGGDLTTVAHKRPTDFFARWLENPEKAIANHRMPVFRLAAEERQSLARFLQEQGKGQKSEEATEPAEIPAASDSSNQTKLLAQGKLLLEKHRCAACHTLPGFPPSPERPAASSVAAPLNEKSDWAKSCAGTAATAKAKLAYGRTEAEQTALQVYFSTKANANLPSPDHPNEKHLSGKDILQQKNCLACHAREELAEASGSNPQRLADHLIKITDKYDDLAPQAAALAPPSLNGVGDKLTDAAFNSAIQRQGEPHRPYLLVRMPQFNLSDAEVAAVAAYFQATDRIPARPDAAKDKPTEPELAARNLAGSRLVSSAGFGCTSCHAIGTYLPVKASAAARGPTLSHLDLRVRREWYERWVRNPSRIIPRMEMPSVQQPVKGVLHDQLEDQLAAVWQVLNTPGFEPPPPSPVRTLRFAGTELTGATNSLPQTLQDVIQTGKKTYLRPFAAGFANRHNVLLDCETGHLAEWWLGDFAYQQTSGKSWFWQIPRGNLLPAEGPPQTWQLITKDVAHPIRSASQFVAQPLAWQTAADEKVGSLVVLKYQLQFANEQTLAVEEQWQVAAQPAETQAGSSSWVRTLRIRGLNHDQKLKLWVSKVPEHSASKQSAMPTRLVLNPDTQTAIVVQDTPQIAVSHFAADGVLEISPIVTKEAAEAEIAVIKLTYQTQLPIDTVELPPTFADELLPMPLQLGPGLQATRLPLSSEIMPTGLAWTATGDLVFCSLKGNVFAAHDTPDATGKRDGWEDKLELLADGLPAPYGIATGQGYVDVLTKPALVRFAYPSSPPTRPELKVVASGWGYTADYHDWAVGLIADGKRGYYLGIPCQQDDRTVAAAKYRGSVLHLSPQNLPPQTSQLKPPVNIASSPYAIEVLSRGHRFPMGLAVNPAGDLFVTDNQGNYNPFN